MIDFHTHIIPTVDDGSKSVEETFGLLSEAKEAGFDKIILTPHYMEPYYISAKSSNNSWLKALNVGLSAKKIDLKLYLANEVYITDDIIKLLKNEEISSINDTKYLLMELPLNAKPMNLYSVMFSLQKQGYIPILAHPERYSFVQSEPELVYQLIKKGVLIQSNFGSIVGQYGKKSQIIITKLLENNMVHFLGSDVHIINSIYIEISEAFKKIKKVIGEEKFQEITCINPELVLNNKNINTHEPTPIKFSFKEKLALKRDSDK